MTASEKATVWLNKVALPMPPTFLWKNQRQMHYSVYFCSKVRQLKILRVSATLATFKEASHQMNGSLIGRLDLDDLF